METKVKMSQTRVSSQFSVASDVTNFLWDYATFFASGTISSEKVSIELQRVLKAV